MRKKSLVLFSSLAILLLGSCGTQHSHTFASDWTHDENNHWHVATCEHKDEVADKASHTFGDWSVKKLLLVKKMVLKKESVQYVKKLKHEWFPKQAIHMLRLGLATKLITGTHQPVVMM